MRNFGSVLILFQYSKNEFGAKELEGVGGERRISRRRPLRHSEVSLFSLRSYFNFDIPTANVGAHSSEE